MAETTWWPRAWGLIWTAAPRQTVAALSLMLVQGLLPVAWMLTLKVLVDSIVQTALNQSFQEDALRIVALVIAAGGLMLFAEVLQSVTEWIRTWQSELVSDYIRGLIHSQAAKVDLAFYEMPEYHDRLEQARGDAATRPLALLDSIASLGQNVITLVAIAAVLVPYGPMLPVALLVSTFPALYVALGFDRRYHRWWQASTVDRRRAQYYDGLLTQSTTAAELRLFSLGQHFRGLYQGLRGGLRDERLALVRRQALARLAAGTVGLLISGVMVAWMVWRAVLGMVTIGDLVLFYQAFQRAQMLVRSLLGNLSQIYSNTLFLGNLFAFLDIRPQVKDPETPRPAPTRLEHGIRFRDVSFAYPGSERLALDHFDLAVPAGKIVAIVGANGTGKSTLIKLVCRFYDPQRGSIEFDGVDIRSFAVDDLRRQLSVLFQLPVCYVASAHENIALGDLAANPTLSDTRAAARLAGADEFTERLPRGYASLLGKWFSDGNELSGGEWQRLAAARAYLRSAPVILLDEPTSFMDSWGEADWFMRFRTLASGRTGLVITHRFTIAMRADVIHVMDRGRIIESGTHHELMALGGVYAQSWTTQMQAAMAPATQEVAAETAA